MKREHQRTGLRWEGYRKPVFEARRLAALLNVTPRRIEGWVERGLLRPAQRGHGPGRRRLFSVANALQGALILELQKTLGDKHPHLKEYISYDQPLVQVLPGGAQRVVMKGELSLVARFAADIFGEPSDGRDPREIVVAIATSGDARYSVLIGLGVRDNQALREQLGYSANPIDDIREQIARKLEEGASVTMFSLSRIVNQLRDRIDAEFPMWDDLEEQ